MSIERNNMELDGEFVEFHSFCTRCPSPQPESNSADSSANMSGSVQPLPSENNDEPNIRLHRKGDIIDAIEFQCTCGKRTIVHLIYDGD